MNVKLSLSVAIALILSGGSLHAQPLLQNTQASTKETLQQRLAENVRLRQAELKVAQEKAKAKAEEWRLAQENATKARLKSETKLPMAEKDLASAKSLFEHLMTQAKEAEKKEKLKSETNEKLLTLQEEWKARGIKIFFPRKAPSPFPPTQWPPKAPQVPQPTPPVPTPAPSPAPITPVPAPLPDPAPPTTPAPPTPPAPIGPKECSAHSVASFRACLSNDTVVRVTSDIVFGPGESIQVAGFKNITIDGKTQLGVSSLSETSARFSGNKDEEYLRVVNSSNITVKNLKFTSQSATQKLCMVGGPFYNQNNCRYQLFIDDSQSVLMDSLIFDNEKMTHLALRGVRDIAVTNSYFKDATVFGIWMDSPTGMSLNQNISVVQNTFTGVGANAILFAAFDGVNISKNLFLDNHQLTQYIVNGHGVGGGQLLFENSAYDRASKNAQIIGNSFKVTNRNSAVTGIEFAAFAKGSLSNVLISQNTFEGHTGDVFTIDYDGIRPNNLQNVMISNNVFKDNFRTYKSQLIAKGIAGIGLANNQTSSHAGGGLFAVLKPLQKNQDCVVRDGQNVCGTYVTANISGLSGGPMMFTARPASSIPSKAPRVMLGSLNETGRIFVPSFGEEQVIVEMFFKSDFEGGEGWSSAAANVVF